MTRGAYYNEFDPFAAQWLRNLISAGHIADGVVDERSISDVHPDDLVGFTQCHFFAGIGGWSLALRLAGWPDDRPVWTGSPPCQPFSTAGKQEGIKDERHLAPVWLDLVKKRHPPIVFGEQVAAAVTKDNWLDDLQDALEAENYATGAVVLPACSVGSPHTRQRLWIVAERVGDANGAGSQEQHGEWDELPGPTKADVVSSGLGDADEQSNGSRARGPAQPTDARGALWLANSVDDRQRPSTGGQPSEEGDDSRRRCEARRLANTELPGHEDAEARGSSTESSEERLKDPDTRAGCGGAGRADPLAGQWAGADWLLCRDGKWRPVESGSFPLANGFPNRVGILRGFGNAIVPQVAAEVIGAYLDA